MSRRPRALVKAAGAAATTRLSNSFASVLARRRFRSVDQLTRDLQQQQHQQQQQKHAATRALSTQKVWRGVHKGNYVRVKLPKQLLSSSSSSFAAAFSPMLLPSVMIVPPSWPSNWRGKAAAMVNAATHPSQWSTWWSRFQAWWSQHWGTVAMNIGSVCTLIGFTRTDVLELRAFSLTGSVGAIFYNMAQMPVRYPPILWSATFAAVNATKIWQIMQERGAAVHLTAFEEETYNQFFLPHGVTPKQFESIYHKATLLKINKDDCIIKKDDKLDQVYLIIEGTTKANIRGRHLTAASFSMDSRDTKQGGASGAWIGEMSFLESLWIREQQKRTQQQKEAAVDERPTMEGSGETNAKPTANVAKEASPPSVISTKKTGTDVPIEGEAQKKPTEPTAAAKRVAPGAMVRPTPKASLALYTIVAKEECQVLRWTYDEMEELLAKSTDLRGAMTRAMTQAIVGKVINFTVSKSAGTPTWSAWLDDWKYSAAADVKVERIPDGKTALGVPEDGSLQNAPQIRGLQTKDTVPDFA